MDKGVEAQRSYISCLSVHRCGFYLTYNMDQIHLPIFTSREILHKKTDLLKRKTRRVEEGEERRVAGRKRGNTRE